MAGIFAARGLHLVGVDLPGHGESAGRRGHIEGADAIETVLEETAVVRKILLEIPIAAPRERVWEALVGETAAWFVSDPSTGPATKTFRVEPQVGGRMYEDWGNGEGLLWGHVILVQSPQTLHVAGDCSPQWGGPNRGIMIWELAAEDDGSTTVRFEHALHGNVSDETVASYDGGWRIQLVQGLKGYNEAPAD